MTYRLVGERYEGVFAEELDHDVARRWLDEAHGWFDDVGGIEGAGGGAGAASGGAHSRFALVESPLGLGLAKEVAPGRMAFRRRSRAQRLFQDALQLAAVGVATAQPFAALLPRRRSDRAVFVAERVDAPTLEQWAREGARAGAGAGGRAELARAAADALARMHRSGLRHRDLKAPNVLVEPELPGIVLIDLDGVQRKRLGLRRSTWRCRGRDLARLRLSLRQLSSEALELERELWRPLLAHYCQTTGDDPKRLDAWTRRWAERHRRKNARRGRPTA